MTASKCFCMNIGCREIITDSLDFIPSSIFDTHPYSRSARKFNQSFRQKRNETPNIPCYEYEAETTKCRCVVESSEKLTNPKFN